MRVRDSGHADTGLEGLEHICAGAHNAAGRSAVILALLLRKALLDDDAWHRGEFPGKPVVRLLQGNSDLAGPGRLNRLNPVEYEPVEYTELGIGIPLQAVDYVCRRHWVTIPEPRPRPEGEHELGWRAVGQGGQAGLQRAVRPLPEQRFAHQGDSGVFRVIEGVDRIERVHVPVYRPGNRGHRRFTRR